uniref:Aspartyl/asparaginy/proline hydroxylase domain-containing protein n=1 Tax=Ursus maritimus TaxID=29073 RepID=A0A452U382_URSMA
RSGATPTGRGGATRDLGGARAHSFGRRAALRSRTGPTGRSECRSRAAHSQARTGLKIPPGCELVVGGEPQCWAEGHCLLVDDSFLHTVAHNGSPEDGPRVVFIVDLWHPNVAGAERQALDFVFAPDP